MSFTTAILIGDGLEFLIPMRGNERYTPTSPELAKHKFLIPMRGNETRTAAAMPWTNCGS